MWIRNLNLLQFKFLSFTVLRCLSGQTASIVLSNPGSKLTPASERFFFFKILRIFSSFDKVFFNCLFDCFFWNIDRTVGCFFDPGADLFDPGIFDPGFDSDFSSFGYFRVVIPLEIFRKNGQYCRTKLRAIILWQNRADFKISQP